MRGATAPRLLLELICARVLLPGADHGTDGVLARLDRLERRVAIGAPVERYAGPDAPPRPAGARPRPARRPGRREPAPERRPGAAAEPHARADAGADTRADAEPAPPAPAAAAAGPPAALTLVDVRRLWPDIVEAIKSRRRLTWIHLTQNAQVVAVDGTTLTLGLQQRRRPRVLRRRRQRRDRPAGRDRRGRRRLEDRDDRRPGRPAVRDPVAGHARRRRPSAPTPPEPTVAVEPPATPSTTDPAAVAAAREAIQQTRVPGKAPAGDPRAAADADAHPDDDDVDSSGLAGAELLQRDLGAEVIEEIKHH